MANMVRSSKKIALLHRYPKDRIKETNSAFIYLNEHKIDVLTFKSFNRMGKYKKAFKSFCWIFYSGFLVAFKKYDVIYCDDSFPFYPIIVRLASPKSKIVIRLGDFHLMYYVSGLLYRTLHMIEKMGWRMADKILTISPAMHDRLTEEHIYSDVVLDPIDADHFKPSKVKPNEDIVMFHGLLTANKNIDIIIKAALRLPKVWFWIVGDGPELSRLRSVAPENVIFTGWHEYEHMPSLIDRCKIGLALRSSNVGNNYIVTTAFLQYASMGKPCLVTKRPVFDRYAWQFTSIDELVDKIKILLNNPEEGKKLRRKILRSHNAKKIAKQIWAHLQA